MISSGLLTVDRLFGPEGYPDKSTILVIARPDVEKELLNYAFVLEGIRQGDFCLYVTNQSVKDVSRDSIAEGFDLENHGIYWIAGEGGQSRYPFDDLSKLSFDIKEALKKSNGKRTRTVVDVLSSLLLLNSSEKIYRFLTQLFNEVRQYSGALIATLDEDMNDSRSNAAMEELFDGILQISHVYDGAICVKLRKMKGLPLDRRHAEGIAMDSKLHSLDLSMEVKRSKPPGLFERSPTEVEKAVRETPLFSSLTSKGISEICGGSEARTFQKEEFIVREGEIAQVFFLILEGQVEVRQRGKTIKRMGRGQFFGEATLGRDEVRSADVVAIERTSCLIMSASQLKEFINANPEIAIKLLEEMIRRNRIG